MGVAFGSGVEWAVRPFAAQENILQRYIDARPLPNQDAEANIRWGGKSDFVFDGSGGFGTVINIIKWPDDGGGDEDVEEWTEEGREWGEEIRVENPDDSDQYVMVQDTLSITFRTPKGKLVRLKFQPQER